MKMHKTLIILLSVYTSACSIEGTLTSNTNATPSVIPEVSFQVSSQSISEAGTSIDVEIKLSESSSSNTFVDLDVTVST